MHNPPLILIVDDNSDDVYLMAAALEREGYEIVTARDGEQALAQIGATSPVRCVTFSELPEQGTKQRTPAEVVLTSRSPRGAGPKGAGKR